MVKEFDLSFEEAGPMSMLTIHGFFNLDEIFHYYKMIYGADGYATALDKMWLFFRSPTTIMKP